MGNNVNTLPSSDVDSLSIRWITFATRDKENVIDAKKWWREEMHTFQRLEKRKVHILLKRIIYGWDVSK